MSLGFDPAPGKVEVRAVPLLLRELFANLLDNAIRYTPAGGEVSVRVVASPAPAVIVEDTGGGIPENLPTGYYVAPTLLADVDPDARISQEEIFGPVLTVTPYDTDDDAIAIANNSIYGLSGSVLSADRERALGVARRIRSGTMSVNGGLWYAPDAPFGGYKQSGIGREMGVAGLDEFLERKTFAEPA